ncbi:lipase 2 [Aureobasidium pullulans]|nr:lipase 2 [Aureobasidium pullulans]
MKVLASGFLLLNTASAAATKRYNAYHGAAVPTVQVKNGTYTGYYAAAYNTDNFLGMPYAQPPIGDLRFRIPQSLNSTWSGSKNATECSPECIGYGRDTWSQGNYVSEDCLTLNVIKPAGSCESLPVLVWIHGGGLVMGGSGDRRYNQSFIVQQSVEAGMPIIAVSINYRLSSWGFLYGREIQESGNTMNGFRDQRLALRWVQENVAAFGGDPDRVTIQGESSGGTSVGAQLLAYNGRDDGLFHGAIAQSGAPISPGVDFDVDDWEPIIANISRATGCNGTGSVLDCLRKVPTDQLNSFINSTVTRGARYGPVVDGDWFTQTASQALSNGDFLKVPYIIGVNEAEGVGFGPRQINTTQEILDYIVDSGYDNATAHDLAILYPDIPAIGVPSTLHGRPNSTIGLQFKRSSTIAQDMSMNAARRLTSHWWARHGARSYTYIFNALVNGLSYFSGAVHFQEVAFVFYNTEGLGYPQNGNPNPLGGPESESLVTLAKQMCRMWISFVNYGDPNMHLGCKSNCFASLKRELADAWGLVKAEPWNPVEAEEPEFYYFQQNETSKSLPDIVRAEGVSYWEELIMARKGTNCTGIVACGGSYDGDLDNL